MARKRKRSRSRKVCKGKGANRICFRKPRRLGRGRKGRGPAVALNCGDVPKTRKNAMDQVRRWKAIGKSAKMSKVKAPTTYVVCHN